jgi:hypothetical protein
MRPDALCRATHNRVLHALSYETATAASISYEQLPEFFHHY